MFGKIFDYGRDGLVVVLSNAMHYAAEFDAIVARAARDVPYWQRLNQKQHRPRNVKDTRPMHTVLRRTRGGKRGK